MKTVDSRAEKTTGILAVPAMLTKVPATIANAMMGTV